MAFKVPEQARITYGTMASTAEDGNNGLFRLTFKLGEEEHYMFIVASDGGGWEHVSVTTTVPGMTPTWEMMCSVKDLFWSEDDCVLQFHPPKKEYVNNHPHCLHLWREADKNAATPPKWMIGV